MRLASLALVSAIGFGAMHIPRAEAIGCVSGGAAGAVAGHMAHHHTLLGAVGGCIAGHEIHKHDEKAQRQQSMRNTAP